MVTGTIPRCSEPHVALVTVGSGHIEYELIEGPSPHSATLVMLHEGLGSLSMWRDFPQLLAARAQCRVMVYSRHGYGQSAPLSAPRTVSYMHDEALVILPELLRKLGIERPILFGHSDGGSIALIHASNHPVRGVIALAPHVFVEALSVESIAAARIAFETTNLRARLARYHADVDGAFRGWNDIWLHPDFREWNIEDRLPGIACPVLVIQGEEDEYGTVEQMHRIAMHAPAVELKHLAQCGHSPHRDQPERVMQSVLSWMHRRQLVRSTT
jgi:pimeloyl-ACP methyl ester carboxylesterase